MEYERDYIMRLIKQLIRALISVIFNRKGTIKYEMPINDQITSGRDVYALLVEMADAGDINGAENRLYEEIEAGIPNIYQMALAFYDHINDYDDAFLEEHGFSREEIVQGIRNIAENLGYGSMVDALL